MELRDYLRIVRRSWLLIMVAALIGLGAGIGASFLMSAKYESTAQLYVSVRSDETGVGDLVQGSNFARQAVASYVEVATSAIVLEQVKEELSLAESVRSLASRMRVSTPADTVLMDITVTDEDPRQAAEIANTAGEALTEVVENEIEASDGQGSGAVQVSIVQPGTVPDSPVSPRPLLNGVVGLILGTVLSLIAAILRALLDTRLRTVDEVEAAANAPVLAGIAYDRDIDKRPLVVHSARLNPRAESFRSLRTNLQFVATEDGARVFAISSSVPDEGKTTTAANLAIALAETGASVVLVDADLRKPSIASIMGLEGGAGLTDVLIGRAELRDVLQPWGRAELAVLPSGQIPPNPSELLGSAAMQRVVNALGETVDYVVIDTPPILPVTDAAVVSRFATGTMLVAAAGSTKQLEVEAAVEKLAVSGVRLLGVVVTKLPTKGPDSYSYGTYTYGGSYRYDESVPETASQLPPKRARATDRRRS
ncbi:polysaccharide biosynthesis tyrosine autokinase [Yaniella halotolerans]|uniref:polysaccharide biosynthesis tyrosine autokinase n=1 Tax=Yaniella halotolerans TaxID=225453 RepID=UPI0003B5CE89|nr:polysaccharide biosynthesis tyrosine autokinase [Yaniella halotolerans]